MTPNPVMEGKHSTGLHKEIADWGLIYECVAGSKLMGVNLDNADDDRMGVCIEPPEFTLGLRLFEQYVDRSQPMGERSQEGDHDRVIYSLRKWAHLALGGNPTVLMLLFAPDEMAVSWGLNESWWAPWRENSHWFASKRAGAAFLGYMQQQRQRLTGDRGQKNVKRPELEEKYGYDTKYAGHIIRLGLQGVEYLRTGYLNLPLHKEDAEDVRAIRRGQWEFNEMLTFAGELEREIKSLLDQSPLPDQPNYAAVNAKLVNTYAEFYDVKEWRFAQSVKL